MMICFDINEKGDTWASEIGVMSRSPVRLITEPWRIVPKGTNGGVTILGLGASIVGGLFVGITFYFCTFLSLEQVNNDQYSNLEQLIESSTSQYWCIAIATFCSFFGSLLDSLLGATLQFSGVNDRGIIFEDPNMSTSIKHISGRFILNNNHVNFISAIVTCFIGGCLSVSIFS